ncbi:hypothetical protein NDU88_002789 [Pleurodeles waltl]|uniref:Uncharacterized protein n=1 Tax=Pleurodeles waltl TaxID=8319 RepID=A0AAV7WMH4_PLEWA|nr:hypothetical protein NDU88_002789 [Pleurodeles waltl]
MGFRCWCSPSQPVIQALIGYDGRKWVCPVTKSSNVVQTKCKRMPGRILPVCSGGVVPRAAGMAEKERRRRGQRHSGGGPRGGRREK